MFQDKDSSKDKEDEDSDSPESSSFVDPKTHGYSIPKNTRKIATEDEKKEEESLEKESLSTKKSKESATKSDSDSDEEEKEKKVEEPIIPFKDVEKGWSKFVKDSKDLNHSLTALLTLCKPVSVEGRCLIVEVFYPFHKERIESARTRKLLEGLSESVFGDSFNFKCVLCKEKPKKLKKSELEALTDLNVVVPSNMDGKSILEAFDGGLPILG